ncbi:3-phosphoshikimate 1-carboxyvinyltransferase [Wenzhouxiangella sp. XN24]|uniref:3-phosphoshikimate 1-carboxyvinyltransferase n=1 Tax=Wenzhouxiangella sp. XN24 TaxID=2713569 RepID=UPI0013ECC955|nr:3-phosphoshikimate 1-carboxyvinyltransferase [Wenzhouxiangella sp. XN24]NGX16454.1 3-phosphoshikimate 1-carboxyvinyltransferase [Wenzhouxiangella sp. XN24]
MSAAGWRVNPAPTLGGSIVVPGDKSISHRVMLLGAVAEAPLEVQGFLQSEDCLATRHAVESLGARVEELADGGLRVLPPEQLRAPSVPLDFGNSGTGIRLMTGLLAGHGLAAVLDGDESLRRRPMERVAAPLRSMGARIETTAGRPPLRISGQARLEAIDYALPVASAQVKSALLLAGLSAEGRTVVRQPAVCRDHTERLLESLGCPVERGEWGAAVTGPTRPSGGQVVVPGDFSSAAFFIVAGLLAGGEAPIELQGVGMNPTRTGLLDILRMMGGRIEISSPREESGEPVADLRIWRADLVGADVPPELVPLAIDELPALFVAAAYARGETRVRGAEELRVKESDRIAVMARGLEAVGVEVSEQADGLLIRGGGMRGGVVDSGGDHRVAMSFAIGAARASGPIEILDVANVATSFPGFEQAAATLGLSVEPLHAEHRA